MISLPCSSLSSLQERSKYFIRSFSLRPTQNSLAQLAVAKLQLEIYKVSNVVLFEIAVANFVQDLGSSR